MLLLITNIILNSIDILMIFLLSHALIKRIPIFTVKRVLIGLGYGIVMGTVGYLFDLYIYQIIVTFAVLVVTYLIVKLPFANTVLVYTLVWLFGIFQFPLVLIFHLFQLEPIPLALFAQSLTLVTTFLSCKFLPLNKCYRFIEEHMELKLMIFILAFLIAITFFYWNFENTWSYLLYFSGIFISLLIAIYSVGRRIVYLRHTTPLKAYNEYHTALGLMVNAYKEECREEISRLNECYQDDNFKLQMKNLQSGKIVENMITFIKNKQDLYDHKVDIQYEIDYEEDHPNINLATIIKMISILLDNAIESWTDKPIIVDLKVTKSYFQLSVQNEFTPSDSEEMSRIFTIDGYTTKKKNQRGYGLTNLYHDIQRMGGKIVTTYDDHAIGNTQYLNITIII